MCRKTIAITLLVTGLNSAAFSTPANLDDAIIDVAHRWAKVSYQTPEAEREAAFRSVIGETQQIAQTFPGKAEPLIWLPGWPIGFGDKRMAREYLEKALAINPSGIDPNYVYAELLADQGEYVRAVEYIKRALGAPPRPHREDADADRRQDIQRLFESIRQKHGDQLASK